MAAEKESATGSDNTRVIYKGPAAEGLVDYVGKKRRLALSKTGCEREQRTRLLGKHSSSCRCDG